MSIKSINFKRTEGQEVYNFYDYEFTQTELDDLNDYIAKNVVVDKLNFPVEELKLTFEDVLTAYDGATEEKGNPHVWEELPFYNYDHRTSYEQELYDVVSDWINDNIWDSYVDCDYGDTFDCEDETNITTDDEEVND